MRGLATYAMSGRVQAATVAILFGLFPGLSIVSGAVVALVTLRRGWQDGLLILLWALLPAALQWMVGDPSNVCLMLGVLVTASMLRRLQSWQTVLLLILGYGLAMQWSLHWQTAYQAKGLELFEKLQHEGQLLQMAQNGEMVSITPRELLDATLVYYGVFQMLMMFGCLALARHWQALLYNPGGFRQEFHQLRIDPRLMAVVLVLMALAYEGIAPLNDWLFMLCLLPMLQAMAVVHNVIALRNMGNVWLVLAYFLLLIATPVFVLLGVIDTVANLRKRMATSIE